MIPKEILEVRAFRVERMAAKLGLTIAPGGKAEVLERLKSLEMLSHCAHCTDGLRCRSFTSSAETADAAPEFCINREVFEALIETELRDPPDLAAIAARAKGFGGWMAGSELSGAQPASAGLADLCPPSPPELRAGSAIAPEAMVEPVSGVDLAAPTSDL